MCDVSERPNLARIHVGDDCMLPSTNAAHNIDADRLIAGCGLRVRGHGDISHETMSRAAGLYLLVYYALATTGAVALQPLTQRRWGASSASFARQCPLFSAGNDETPGLAHDSSNPVLAVGNDKKIIDSQLLSVISLDEVTANGQSIPEQVPAVIDDVSDDDAVSALKFRYATYDLTCAAFVGILTGLLVAIFKLSIEAVRMASYSLDILDYFHEGAVFIPALGGLMVGLILLSGKLPPGLRGQASRVDEYSKGPVLDLQSRFAMQMQSLRKSAAAVFTLGTGNSLGPEGPCVEIGMGIARACMDITTEHPIVKRRSWNRVLLSCGAAAGVAAGFDAPVAGVFFALEVMQSAFSDITGEQRKRGDDDVLVSEGLFASTSTITPVVLASVLSALCARSILGEHLTFQVSQYSLPINLIELPMYLLLGIVSGCVAFSFSQAAKLSTSFFNGDVGNDQLRGVMQGLSPSMKPVLGGLFCGIVALFVPQILFFGYETLNPLLSNTSMPTSVLLTVLLVKAIATAVSTGSGLVGGTFAPALFLGGVTGASFHNIMTSLYHLAAVTMDDFGVSQGSMVVLADLPAYAMVGSASVLAALFRAPLTASLLLFELSRDYDVILPLIASAGIGSVVADLLDDKFEREKERRRDQDSSSWGDLADRKEKPS